jgi:hypothetical protein
MRHGHIGVQHLVTKDHITFLLEIKNPGFHSIGNSHCIYLKFIVTILVM